MPSMNFKQLIDLAIGSPEPGHVNFYALHFLLYSFAEKLNISEETVDCNQFEHTNLIANSGRPPSEMYLHKKFEEMIRDSARKRISGGAEPTDEEEDKNAAPQEAAAESAAEAPAEAPPTEAPEAEPTETLSVEAIAEAAPAEAATTETPPAEAGAADDIPAATTPEIQQEIPAVPPEPTPATPPSPSPPSPSPQPSPPPSPPQQKPMPQQLQEEQQAKYDATVEDSGQPPVVMQIPTAALQKLEERIANIEDTVTSSLAQSEMQRGVAIMKDQLDLAMEELYLLAKFSTGTKAEPHRMQQLRELSNKLRSIQKANVFIEGRFKVDEDRELSEEATDVLEEEEQEVELPPPSRSQVDAMASKAKITPEQYDLDLHLCYSPEKILDQLLDLKSEFCLLINKVNDISATMLEQDCQRTVMLLNELREQMKDVKVAVALAKEHHERTDTVSNFHLERIERLTARLEDFGLEKLDKTEMAIALADKVDYTQLQRKASVEQFQELQCRMERQLCEVNRLINVNEKNMLQVIENMRSSLGFDNLDEVLRKFKKGIDEEIRQLIEPLQKYLNATDNDCVAAGARVKVLQDLACVSCDTDCVMRTVEKTKVPKLADAHASAIISPLITYELGSIRKSGIMGYYRKDEFPHTTSAWLGRQGQNVNMKMGVPRHAGGAHTTHTAKERNEKVVINNKK